MAVSSCLAFTDFLGLSANKQLAIGRDYKDYICVYALSASRQNDTEVATSAVKHMCVDKLVDLDWNSLIYSNDVQKFEFVKSDSAHYMCYKFSLSDITTDSDTEPDVPYSYEELFNQCVLNNMSASDKMQYGYIYSAYKTSPEVEVTYSSFSSSEVVSSNTNKLMMNDFYNLNSLASTADFRRSDYYKFYVPETDIVHDTSVLELNDGDLASVSNSAHASFNTLLYCINPCFNSSAVSAKYNADGIVESTGYRAFPLGFGDADKSFNAVPISICTFSQDIMLAGQNVLFEPNLNGIVSVH